jgi:hypothetical protein
VGEGEELIDEEELSEEVVEGLAPVESDEVGVTVLEGVCDAVRLGAPAGGS